MSKDTAPEHSTSARRSTEHVARRGVRWFFALASESLARVGTLATFLVFFAHYGDGPTGLALAAYAYAMTAWLFIDLGLGLYGTREVAAEIGRADSMQVEVTATRLASALPMGGVLALALLGVLGAPSIAAVSFVLFVVVRSVCADWRLRGESRFGTLAVVNAAATSVQLLAIAVVLVAGIPWEQGIGLPFMAWSLTLALGTWIVTRPSRRSVPLRRLATHLRVSAGYALTNGVSTAFGQSPVVALSVVYSSAEIASFALVHRVVLSANLLFQALGASMFPDMVQMVQSDHASLRNLQKFAMRITVATALGVVGGSLLIYAVPWVRETYLTGAPRLAVLTLLVFMVIRSLRENTMRLALADGKAYRSAMITLLCVGVYLAGLTALYLLHALTMTNVALAFVCAEVLIFAALLRHVSVTIHGGRR